MYVKPDIYNRVKHLVSHLYILMWFMSFTVCIMQHKTFPTTLERNLSYKKDTQKL